MKVEEYDNAEENEVLAAVLVDRHVAALAAEQAGDGPCRLFASDHANLAGGWGIDHVRKTGTALKAGVRVLYREWAVQNPGPRADTLARFLEYLSDVYARNGKPGSALMVDRAGLYFDRVRAERAADEAKELIAAGRPAEAAARLEVFRAVGAVSDGGGDPFTEPRHLDAVYDEDRSKPLFSYRGSLRGFFSRMLCRERFLAFIATEKGKKSFFLLDLAVRALRNRCKVAYFDTGDMTEAQFDERLAVRIARKPRYAPEDRWPFTSLYPTSIRSLPKYESQVEGTSRTFEHGLTKSEAVAAFAEFMEVEVKSPHPHFRRQCYASTMATAATIGGQLDRWARKGFNADVVIVDYADLLAPLDARMDFRHQQDRTWAHLRGISKDRRVLLVTATQASRAAYKADVIRKEFITEDKRKLGHLSGLVGLNTNEAEGMKDITRLNWVVNRHKRISPARCWHVAGCLDVGAPVIVSCKPYEGKESQDD